MKCKNCGCRCDYIGGLGKYICKACYKQYSVPQSTDGGYSLYAAEVARNDYDFDESVRICDKLLKDNPDDENIKWEKFLAASGIVFFQNGVEKDGKSRYTPSFFTPEIPIDKQYLQSGGFFKNPEFIADANNAEKTRENVAEQIRECRRYDIFISRRGGGSKEKMWAEHFYNYLLSKGIGEDRIFYAEKSLVGNNAEWEPHIYYALRYAKVMVLFASSKENILSPWVKNEWKRYYAYRKRENESNKENKGYVSKTLITVYGGFPVDDLPKELRNNQDIEYKGAQSDDLIYGRLKKALDNYSYSKYGGKEVLFARANAYLAKGQFKKAKQVYETMITCEVQNSEAYWGIVKCERKAFDDYDLVVSAKGLNYNADENVKKALDYADKEQKEHYLKIIKDNVSRSKDGYERTEYEKYRHATRAKRWTKKAGVVAVAFAAAYGAAYGLIGYINPLYYSVAEGAAALTGKSWAFNYTVDDLEIDTFKGYPVTSVADGAFKNSKLQTLTLSDSVKNIGSEAFASNTELRSVSIAGADITIGDYAFKDCTSLTSVTFASSQSAASAAYNLTAYPLASNLSSSRSGVYLGAGAFENCVSLNSITVADCAYIGSNAFGGCTNLTRLVLDISDETVLEEGAFNNIGNSTVIYLPSVSEDILSALEGQYKDLTFGTYTRDGVEECISYISKLESFSDITLLDVERAEASYDALSEDEKQLVTNYSLLQTVLAAYDAAEAIDDIGTVTLASGDDISKAEALYSALTDAQKGIVSNYPALADARAEYDVISAIDAIGEVTILSESDIADVEDMYASLTSAQQEAVLNYSQLVSARNTINELLAAEVIKAINEIGVITSDSSSKITAAEEAYGLLSEEQQLLVTNYQALTDARVICNVVQKIDLIGDITVDSYDAIDAAEKAYNSLTEAQQNGVSNYSELAGAAKIYEVVAAIAAIDTSVSLSSSSAINKADEMFAALDSSEQEKVTNYNYLESSKSVYETVYLISLIGTVTLDSDPFITSAETAYTSLTKAQKARVSNYSVLKNDRSVYDVMNDIDIISNKVTLQSGTAVSAVETAYGKLSEENKNNVSNYSEFLISRNVYYIMSYLNENKTAVPDLSLGKGTLYNYLSLNTSTMEEILNSATVRDEIAYISVSGFKTFETDFLDALVYVFKNFVSIRYDLSVETASANYEFTATSVLQTVVGDPKKVYSVCFSAKAGELVNVAFENFSIAAASGVPIDFTDVTTAYVQFIGASVIKSESSVAAVTGNELIIEMLSGAEVYLSSDNDGDNTSGGAAATAEAPKIQPVHQARAASRVWTAARVLWLKGY